MKRLLEVLSSYSFNLYYLKGKDMVLGYFLSRMEGDNSDLHKDIPISFSFHSILTEHNNAYSNLPREIYRVVTRSHTSVARIKMPEVYGADKAIAPKLKPQI